jgi:hypothetical protein
MNLIRKWYVSGVIWTFLFIPIFLTCLNFVKELDPENAVGLGAIGLAYQAILPALIVSCVGAAFTAKDNKFLAGVTVICLLIILVLTISFI